MRKPLLSAFIYLVTNATGVCQAPFTTVDSITTNNIHAPILVHGDMFWDPYAPSSFNPYICRFVPDKNIAISQASSLWMSGYDGSGQLHVAAQTYRQNGNDYWPGPLDGSTAISYDSSQKWAKIWKVYRNEIQAFQALPTHNAANTPLHILTWPGKGNIFAEGYDNTYLAINTDMAPFADLNGNGIYEPLNGEYPDVKGEEALWWIFNDNGPSHSQSHGNPLGIEVHAMAYGYHRNTLIDDVVYYEYTLTNHSANNYSDFRMAIWDNSDVGYYLDDYIGFDSVHRMGIGYNGTNNDGEFAGHPANSYTGPPPMVGITLIELPGDAGTNYVPTGSFIYYNNDASAIGNPDVDTQYNNYMRSKFRTGIHLKDDFSGPGIPGNGTGTGPNCNYIYTGDPSDTTNWSECAMNDAPGDKRSILASNDFIFNAGETKKIVWAVIVADSAGGCGQTSFSKIKTVADTAWYLYHNPLPPPPAAVANAQKSNVSIYPNPARDKLFINDPTHKNEEANFVIVNTLGQRLKAVFNKTENSIDISALPEGVYQLIYYTPATQKTATFLKQ